MDSIRNIDGSSSAKMFFEVTNTHNYAQKPNYFSSSNKHLIFRFIRLRLDIAEFKASVIGRHKSLHDVSTLTCACDNLSFETREHVLLNCPLYESERKELSHLLSLYGVHSLSLKLLLFRYRHYRLFSSPIKSRL